MTASDSTTRVVSDSGDDIGPGQRLREAREAAQLTLAEVASRMRLEPHVLESLEGDHYERLHGPTFVRGYLSGYARLLDLPERPILEAYERHDHRPPALVSELGRKPEVHVSDFPVRMVTYVIAGLLVVLVVLWWQSRQLYTAGPERANVTGEAMPGGGDAPPAVVESPAATDGTQATQPAPAPIPQVQTPQVVQMPTEGAAMEATADSGGQPSPAMEAAATETPAMEPAATEAAATETPAMEAAATQTAAMEAPADSARIRAMEASPAEQALAVAPQTPAPTGTESSAADGVQAMQEPPASGGTDGAGDAEAPPVTPAPRPAPLPGSDRLAIQLARESWVEIYDRGGGRLYYSLASEGSEVVVEGAGPMRVLLGEIEGAAVDYNGEPFDLSRYRGRSVVRFTVGELSSTTTTPESPAPATAEEPLTRETPSPAAEEQANAVADAANALAVPAATAAPAPEKALPTPAPAASTPPRSPLAGAQPDS